MTDELLAWLRAQLDADERVARSALARQPGRWEVVGDGAIEIAKPDAWATVVFDEGAPSPEQAEHIARHDPTRILRQVAAHRAILDRYEDCLARLNDPEYSTVEAAGQLREYVDFVLPALASIYADRPGYRDEWRP